jgi:DNA-binding NarL/FixJ family response regulator
VTALLRVFLIGLAREDLAALRSRVRQHAGLEIAGEALAVEVEEGRVRIPAAVDAVLVSPSAADRRRVPIANLEPATELDAPIEELTPRERDVLALLADGYGNRVIAARLGISEHTVKFHLASIFGKLNASTRTEAVRRGLDLGLIDI